MPAIQDYYEPWTYNYDHITSAPLSDDMPVAQPHSVLTGEPTDITWSANWDDNLAGAPVGYLFRPYILYRSRESTPGRRTRAAERGWG